MIDYFKANGELMYSLHESLLRYQIRNGNSHIETFLIPRHYSLKENSKRFLTLSRLKSKPEQIRIKGNLRKWYFGERNASADFSKKSLKKCLRILAKKLNTKMEMLLDINLNYLELGGNVVMDRKYDTFIPSIMGFPRLRLTRFEEKSVKFEGEKYQVIFYDKLKELKDRKIITAKVADRLISKKFILRFEVKINAKSGYKYKTKISSFKQVLANFNLLVDHWTEMFSKVQIVDLFSRLKEIKPNSLTKKEYIDFLAFSKIKDMGSSRALMFSDKLVKNRKSQSRFEILNLYRQFTDGKKFYYYKDISNAVFFKGQQLKQAL